MKKIALLLIVASVQGVAHADLQSDALRVMEHRLSMPKPHSVFGKWEADQWKLAAGSCMLNAGLTDKAAALNKFPLYAPGVWEVPKDHAKTCAALALGPSAQCFSMHARQSPFKFPTADFPGNYLFLESRVLPASGSEHDVSGDCTLVRDKWETRQTFAGTATLTWLMAPRLQSFQTPNGKQDLMAGTVSFDIRGAPSRSTPMTAIVPR